MTRHALIAPGLWMAALTLAGPALSATHLTQPDCTTLQDWASGLAPDETFKPNPTLELNTLFRDEQLVPLFGEGILGWGRENFDAVMGWMNECRTAANKARDKATGQSLYAAIKTMKAGLRPLKQYWGQRLRVEKDVESMINQKDFAELPQLLALAQQALHGKDVGAAVKALPPRYQGQGRQAAGLGAARGYFSEAELAGMIDRLEARRTEAGTTVAERNERHESLLREISTVPLDRSGLNQLNRIAYQAPVGEMTREEVDSYNTAFQTKRNAINARIRSEQSAAKQASATLPAPVQEQLEVTLTGDSVDELSLRGLHPGMDYAKAKVMTRSDWGYSEATGGDLLKQFTTTGKQLAQYTEEERRDGGMLEFATMSGRVGEIVFTEHYTGPMDVAVLRKALSEQFGSPHKIGSEDGTTLMQWQQGDSHLQVLAGNRIARMERSHQGYRSSVEVTLWSQEYSDYLSEAQRHCAELRNKPMSELSVNERQALLMGCKTP